MLFQEFLGDDTNHNDTTTEAIVEILNQDTELDPAITPSINLPNDERFYTGMRFCFFGLNNKNLWSRFASVLGAQLETNPDLKGVHTFLPPPSLRRFKQQHPKVKKAYNLNYFVDNLLFAEDKASIFPIANYKL